MKYHIEPMQMHDAQLVRALCLRNIKQTFGDDYNPKWAYDLDALSTSDDYYVASKRGILLVAKVDNTIVGTLGIRSFRSQEPAIPSQIIRSYKNTDTVAYITRAYVEIAYRGKGIGTYLVQSGEAFCMNYYSTIYLHTHPNKQYDSIRFWKNRGYMVIYEENTIEPTVHMHKNLLD